MNRLDVSHQQSIHTLHALGWSARRIARQLSLHRETVGRELRLSKPAKVTTGFEGRSRSQCEAWRTMISEYAHKLKGSASVFSDIDVLALAGSLESVDTSPDWQRIDVQIGSLETEVHRLVGELKVLAA